MNLAEHLAARNAQTGGLRFPFITMPAKRERKPKRDRSTDAVSQQLHDQLDTLPPIAPQGKEVYRPHMVLFIKAVRKHLRKIARLSGVRETDPDGGEFNAKGQKGATLEQLHTMLDELYTLAPRGKLVYKPPMQKFFRSVRMHLRQIARANRQPAADAEDTADDQATPAPGVASA